MYFNKISVFYADETPVGKIDVSVPCVAMLSGMRNDTRETLPKNVLVKIQNMLQDFGIHAKVFGNIHDLSLVDKKTADKLQRINDKFFKNHENMFVFGLQLFSSKFFQEYAENMFAKMLLPRVVDGAGNALPVEVVKNNMRKIVFFSHCYGARMFLYMDRILTNVLRNLKYTPEQIKDIQKQLVLIAESPSHLFNNVGATVVNFISLADDTMVYKDLYTMDNYVNYSEKYSMVATPRIFRIKDSAGRDKEHHIWPFRTRKSMTEQGRETIHILRHVFYNAMTLPRVENVQSLLNGCEMKKNIAVRPALKAIEKMPNADMKNFAFLSLFLAHRARTNHVCTAR